MADIAELNTTEQREEWFLAVLGEDNLPVGQMLKVARAEADAGNVEVADGWLELLIDELAGGGDKRGAMLALAVRVALRGSEREFRSVCRDCALKIFDDRVGKLLVESCGFDEKIDVAECVRRLDILTRLSEGVLCYEKTWGFGAVKRVDDFYKKVTIDFSKKPRHQMSFSYAAESLTLLDEGHLLAVQFREPERIEGMLKEDPAGIVKMALESLGEMSAVGLQECLVEHGILKDDDWKAFWDKARKALKADPLVEVPGKRSDPITILDSEKAYDDAWFDKLLKETDVDRVLGMLEELLSEAGTADLSEKAAEAIRNRIQFALKADRTSNPGRLGQTVVLWGDYKGDGDEPDYEATLALFMEGDRLVKASTDMPVKSFQKLIEVLSSHDQERFACLILDNISEMPIGALNSLLEYIVNNGRRDELVSRLTAAFNAKKVSCGPLLWLSRQDDILARDSVLSYYNLLVQMLVTLEGQYAGLQLKLRNQLAALLEKGDWLKGVMEKLSPEQREDVLRRVKNQSGLETSSKRSIMGRMIKMYPELEKVMASAAGKAPASVRKGRFTSYRSYREKQEQLRKIVDEDIPKNSKDIGIARSYGDLRENAEYETAKQNQALLMKRKDELEHDLVQVQATDFKEFPSDRAGMGTFIRLESAGGNEKSFNILGEWDSDESLGIISSRSKLAEVLIGKAVGDEVDLPGVDEKHKVAEVADVSDEIKSWMNPLG